MMSLHWTWGSEWWSFSTFFGRSLFALGLTETLEFLQDLNLEKRWSRMTLNLKSNFSEAAAARIVAINLHRSSWKLASFHPCCLLHFSRKNARDKICNLAAAAISHCLKITQNVPLDFFNFGIFYQFLVLSKVICLVTLLTTSFKFINFFGTFIEFVFTQNVNVEWDFFCDFKTPCDLHISWPKRLREVGQRLYNFVHAYYILFPRFIISVLWYTVHFYYAWYSNDLILFPYLKVETYWDTRL